MFKAIVGDTKAWKSSIEAIAALIDEGTFQIDKEGMKLRAMDPSQIALVDFELPARAFEVFEIENPITLTIDFSELSKITKRIRTEDRIELNYDGHNLKLIFQGQTKREFNLGVLESTTTATKEPNIEFTAKIKFGSTIFKEALKDAELVSNHVALSITNEGFSIESRGDTGSVNISFPEENILAKEVKENARAVFSLTHLDNLLKAADPGSIIVLSLRTDAPLRLEYAIGEGRVVYYLAPRIETV